MEETNEVTPSTIRYVVKSAVYGGASRNAPYKTFAADVSAELQKYLNKGIVQLCISNGVPSPNPGLTPYPPFPDTAPGYHKGFAAVVTVTTATGTADWYFACSEGQTIDFSVQPRDVIHSRVLQLTNLQMKYAPTKQYVFGPCGFTLINKTNSPFPGSANPSPWVSIDFYLTAANAAGVPITPTAANKIGDMPCKISPSPLAVGQSQNVSASSKDLFNISRMLEQNPAIGPTPGTACYVFATMRQPDGTIQPESGAFFGPFNYNGVQPARKAGD